MSSQLWDWRAPHFFRFEVISHASEFVNQVCNEIWKVEGGILAERTKRNITK